MKIIIAGSRDVTDYDYLRHAMVVSGFWKQYGKSIEVVCGMARGADLLGKEFAEKNGLIVHEFPADWKGLGKAAGHIRNVEMGKFVKEHNGLILALWDGESRGTKHMLEWCRDNQVKGYIYRVDKPVRYVPVGTKVTTDFSGKVTKHVITAKTTDIPSNSGVCFQVSPAVPKSGGIDGWLSADWFELEEI